MMTEENSAAPPLMPWHASARHAYRGREGPAAPSEREVCREGLCHVDPSVSFRPTIDPETIAKMSAALESVCETLSLKMVDDAATRLVARKIIELTQRGVRDAAALRAMTLNEFKYE
jgi:hypothetical protein